MLIDWNRNNRIDPVDIGISIAAFGTEIKEISGPVLPVQSETEPDQEFEEIWHLKADITNTIWVKASFPDTP